MHFFLQVQQATEGLLLLTDFPDEQISFSREQAAVELVLKDSHREEVLNYNSAAVLSEEGHYSFCK